MPNRRYVVSVDVKHYVKQTALGFQRRALRHSSRQLQWSCSGSQCDDVTAITPTTTDNDVTAITSTTTDNNRPQATLFG